MKANSPWFLPSENRSLQQLALTAWSTITSARISSGLLLSTMATSCALAASTPALDLPDGTARADFLDQADGMYGWSFTVTGAPVMITGVGWYDAEADGLFHNHQIGIWRGLFQSEPGLLLSSTMVPAGTEATLDGLYRRVDFDTPLMLEPGVRYELGGTYQFDSEDVVMFRSATTSAIQTDPRIILGLPTYAAGGGFRMPDTGLLFKGVNVGPMLFIEPVPEPSSGLLVVAFACGTWLMRRKQTPDGGV